MKFSYSIVPNLELEEKARTQPYLFSPSSYSSVNSFLMGTQIYFQEKPLSRDDSWQMLRLMESYLHEFKIKADLNALVHYGGSGLIEYRWFNRSHHFSVSECKIDVNVDKPYCVGSKILVPNHMLSHMDAESQLFDVDRPAVRTVKMIETLYEKKLKHIFQIDKKTRISIGVHVDPLEMNIKMLG